MVGFLCSQPIAYAITELKSEGEYQLSKGTKAESDYEETAGAPVYEYGKGLKVGPAIFKPYVNYAHRWDNNIFRDENGRRSDHINAVTAGLTGEMPLGGGQHLLFGGYGVDAEWFDRFSDQDHDDHNTTIGANLNFVPFTLSVDENFKKTVDRAGTEFTQRVSREENTIRGLLEVPFSQFFLETEVFDFNIDYTLPEDDVFDHHDFTIFQRAGIDITPATQALVEYGYKNISYDNSIEDRDGDANQFALGLRGYFSERLTYQIWGGAQFRVYDDSVRPDYHGMIARGALKYELSEKSYLMLRGDRVPQESTFDGQSFYVRNRGSLLWKQQIMERLFFNVEGLLQYNEYSRNTQTRSEVRTRRDLVWESGVGLEYFMPNELVSFFCEYNYRARESNTDFLSYDSQMVSAGVKANF